MYIRDYWDYWTRSSAILSTTSKGYHKSSSSVYTPPPYTSLSTSEYPSYTSSLSSSSTTDYPPYSSSTTSPCPSSTPSSIIITSTSTSSTLNTSTTLSTTVLPTQPSSVTSEMPSLVSTLTTALTVTSFVSLSSAIPSPPPDIIGPIEGLSQCAVSQDQTSVLTAY